MLPYAPYFSVYCLDRIDSIDTEQEYICLQWGLFPFWDIFQCSKGINNLEKGLSLFPVLHGAVVAFVASFIPTETFSSCLCKTDLEKNIFYMPKQELQLSKLVLKNIQSLHLSLVLAAPDNRLSLLSYEK